VSFVAALRRRASLVLLATLAALAFGAVSVARLPSGIYPDVDFPRVVVVARGGDLPPEVLQTAVTRPLEEAVATVPGLVRLRSRTIRGATELSAQFAPGSDMWRTLQLVETHVAQIRGDLPPDAEIRIERVTPTALPIVTFNVSGDVDTRALRDAAALIVRPALTQVPGVGSVEIQGGDVREIEVILRPDALAAAHLRPSTVADRIAASEIVAAVGRASAEHQLLTVMAAYEPITLAQIGQIPVAQGPNGAIPLAAVADVVEGVEDRTTAAAGPRGDVVAVTVSRAPGASAPDVVHAARDIVRGLERSALPRGVHVDVIYDQSELIDDAMAGVRDAIVLGVLLGFVVLALFLRDLRAGLAAAVAVPITLVATFGVMKLLGQTLNLMSMGGLAVAIGLVVDDAIVIVEAIVLRREEGMPVAEATDRGTADLLAAVIGTTLTTVVVFAPLGLLSGVVGSFFGALATTLCAAVVLSLLVSISLVPVVASWLLKARPAGGPPRAQGRLYLAYGRLVRRVIQHPVLSVAGIVLLALAGLLAARALDTGFLPTMDEGALVVDFATPQGTSLDETDRIVRRIDRILETTPGVVSFTRRTGVEMGPATATQQNTGDVMVRLAPRDQRPSVYEVMELIRQRLGTEVPEARVEFVQVLQDVLDDLSGNPNPLEVAIFGPDQKVLEEVAVAAASRIEKVSGLEDFFNGVEGSVPVLRADVAPGAALRLGVTPADVVADLSVALAGRVAASVRQGDRTFGIRVRMPDKVRFDPTAIERLPLGYGDGSVALSSIARLSRPVGPAVLLRQSLTQVILLSASIRPGVDLAGTTEEVADRLADLRLPAGYRLEVGGHLASARQTQRDVAGVLGLGVALVLAVLLVQLRSLRLALVVLIGAPLALVGAFLTLLATGIPLNASSLMGCVLLAGLVVKNGILLLEHAQTESAATGDFADAVVRAGVRRLRPILMTTAATVMGLLPLAFGFGAGSELQRPLAVAVIGGLVLSTLVTLLAVPALACALMRRRGPGPA